jgi:hypothetical protein
MHLLPCMACGQLHLLVLLLLLLQVLQRPLLPPQPQALLLLLEPLQ